MIKKGDQYTYNIKLFSYKSSMSMLRSRSKCGKKTHIFNMCYHIDEKYFLHLIFTCQSTQYYIGIRHYLKRK